MLLLGEMIKFPELVVELTEEEFDLFEQYKEKLSKAKNTAEMNYYYEKAKEIIENANSRKNQSNL